MPARSERLLQPDSFGRCHSALQLRNLCLAKRQANDVFEHSVYERPRNDRDAVGVGDDADRSPRITPTRPPPAVATSELNAESARSPLKTTCSTPSRTARAAA
jgi:hypothetical protein